MSPGGFPTPPRTGASVMFTSLSTHATVPTLPHATSARKASGARNDGVAATASELPAAACSVCGMFSSCTATSALCRGLGLNFQLGTACENDSTERQSADATCSRCACPMREAGGRVHSSEY